MHWDKGTNGNGVDNKNVQVNGKRTMDDNGKRELIRKRYSTFSIGFGARDRKCSERLYPSCPANDQNQ